MNHLETGPHTVEIDELEQRYHVHGAGPLVFAHSGGPGLGWGYLRMPDVKERLTVVYLEPIGTGESGKLDDPAGYTYSRYARQLEGLADHFGIERITIIGHSSKWSTVMADALPDARSVVLEDSGHFGHIETLAEFAAAVTSFVLVDASVSGATR